MTAIASIVLKTQASEGRAGQVVDRQSALLAGFQSRPQTARSVEQIIAVGGYMAHHGAADDDGV